VSRRVDVCELRLGEWRAGVTLALLRGGGVVYDSWPRVCCDGAGLVRTEEDGGAAAGCRCLGVAGALAAALSAVEGEEKQERRENMAPAVVVLTRQVVRGS
jgi:hypothetical protein